jgi:hypothetical protein
MRPTCARVLAIVVFAGLLGSPAARTTLAAKGPAVTANGAQHLERFNGLTAGEWLVRWWQEELTTVGAATNVKGKAVTRKTGMRLLGAPITEPGSPTVTVAVTVTPGTPLFLPFITVECSVAEEAPFHGDNEAELRACANGLLDQVVDLAVAIDGAPVSDPWAYRVDSPLFRFGPVPEDNPAGLPAGTQSDSVAAGFAMLFPPFSVGVHRIDVRATVDGAPVAVDAELVITVEPPGKKK